jgi:hypothetical protein
MGRGGFRPGAGRPGRRLQVHRQMRLSIGLLAEGSLLAPHATSSWMWSTGGGLHVGSMYVRVLESGGALDVAVAISSPEGHATGFRTRVDLRFSVAGFGGTRRWFLCSGCSRKRSFLYVNQRQDDLACGGCLGVAYRVQSLTAMDRMWCKLDKIERKLSSGTSRWDERTKPRGMHQRTFKRLSSEYRELWSTMLRSALARDDLHRAV